MRRSALADVLRDLAPGAGALPARAIAGLGGGMEVGALQATPADAAEEAYKVGLAEGRREALAETEHLLEEARAQADARLERERAQWIASVAGTVEDKLAEGFRSLENELYVVVSRCLAPMVRDFASAEALNQILAGVQGALSIGKDATLNVEGPERLLEVLADRLDKQGIAYRLVPSTGVDIKIQVGSTAVVTRLGELLGRFEECVG